MKILNVWQKLQKYPGGKWAFSCYLGRMIPYTGSIRPMVLELQPGFARIQMKDRKCVRNHLNSIHAIALMNLAELTSGLATVGALPPTLRGILTQLNIEYFKKARGTITGSARCEVPTKQERHEHIVMVDLFNEAGEAVCRARATWLIGPAS
jgi:acyl-coenzyme A thioesterase PaaI-like protein